MKRRAVLALPAALLSSFTLSVLAHEGGPFVAGTPNIAPPWLGRVIAAECDGVTDDLLTAGLGKTGLGGTAPLVTDPTDPKQLRRLAIYNN
jgi:hydroxybutyrate-dimer hydrolase